MTILSFKHGLSKHSAYGLCSFGVTLCGNRGDKIGYLCGQLALVLLDKMQEKESRPFVHSLFYGIISIWYSTIHNALAPLKQMYLTGFEIGSLECVTLGGSTYCMYGLLSGTNLATLLDDIEHFRPSMPVLSKFFLSVNQTVVNFHDLERVTPGIIEGELFDYQLCFDEKVKDYDKTRCLVVCIFAACIFNHYNLALKLCMVLRPLSKFISFFYMGPCFLLYDGLVSLIEASLQEDEEEQEALIEHAKKNIAELRDISNNAPMNYLNKLYLLEAELAVVEEDESKAILSYKNAITLSEEHGFVHEQAMICERAAMYYIQRGFALEAEKLLLQSFDCFKKWGAMAKLKSMIMKFPTIFNDKKNPYETGFINMEVGNQSMASVSTI